MKLKYFFILVVTISLFTSCIDKTPPFPPTILVTPDSLAEISPTSPLEYIVTVSSDEDLKEFNLTSRPAMFFTDSSFNDFAHEGVLKISLRTPSIMPALPEDSIVVLEFEVTDTQNSEIVERQVRVCRGYIDIISDSTILTSLPDGDFLYSTVDNAEYQYSNTISTENIDFAFAYDAAFGYIICSPDAPYIESKFAENELVYPASVQNHTKIFTLNMLWSDLNFKTIYGLDVSESFIDNNPNKGVGVSVLYPTQILGFETHDGRKGVIQIISTENQELKMLVKVQATSMPE